MVRNRSIPYHRVSTSPIRVGGPGSSLDGELLAACLKALITDQFLAELATPPASCGAICMDQAARMALLATMPTLDDVDITVV
jgi:hypothetical protein